MKKITNYPRIRRIWLTMIARCESSIQDYSLKHYKNYYLRGIRVCQEWYDYKNFESWALASGYDKALSIDRVNNDGNYHPDNCRWVTSRKNSRNKRTVYLDEWTVKVLRYIKNSRKITYAELARILGVHRHTVRCAILGHTWSEL